MEKKKGLSLQTILTIAGIALIYVLAFLLDRIPGVPIMLTTVLRKGAIYSLVAVSMNLLNGFTGLFSLGQAGFMLVGAYAFAAINISSGIRSTVYQYYDPLLKFSLTETLQNALGNTAGTVLGVFVSLLLAGLLAAAGVPHRPARPEAQERLSGHRHARLRRDHPRAGPARGVRARHQRLAAAARLPVFLRYLHAVRDRRHLHRRRRAADQLDLRPRLQGHPR